jgi:hypothetical protein
LNSELYASRTVERAVRQVVDHIAGVTVTCRPGRVRSRSSAAALVSTPCTSTSRRAMGRANRPVPTASSSTGPAAGGHDERHDDV